MLTSKMMFHFFLRKAAWICPFRESVAIFALSWLTVKIKIIKAKKQKAQQLMKKTPKTPQNKQPKNNNSRRKICCTTGTHYPDFKPISFFLLLNVAFLAEKQ